MKEISFDFSTVRIDESKKISKEIEQVLRKHDEIAKDIGELKKLAVCMHSIHATRNNLQKPDISHSG